MSARSKTTESHWDKTPYWTPERRYLICFLTFADCPEFVDVVRMIQRDLREAPIALSPPESLHQTMPGATTREQLTESDVRNIRSSIRKALDGFSSFVLFADRVKSFPEGSEILLKPSQNLNDLHRLLHTAISEGWGKPADGSPGKVLPHITIGYCNGVGDASLLYAVEEKYQKMKVSAPVNHVDLIWLRRESDRYAWDIIERFPLRQIG